MNIVRSIRPGASAIEIRRKQQLIFHELSEFQSSRIWTVLGHVRTLFYALLRPKHEVPPLDRVDWLICYLSSLSLRPVNGTGEFRFDRIRYAGLIEALENFRDWTGFRMLDRATRFGLLGRAAAVNVRRIDNSIELARDIVRLLDDLVVVPLARRFGVPEPDIRTLPIDRWPVSGVRAAGAQIDVIIPVYGGLSETLRCIHSVLTARCNKPFRLIVINDASPDIDLANRLELLAAHCNFMLLANEKNLGFVATVNRGMSISSQHDVVLLNADTEVFDGWLDGLYRAAYSAPNIASVTPSTNNGTICSYPSMSDHGNRNLEISPPEIAAICLRANSGFYVDLPTNIGFCTFMRRAAIDDIGLFDVEAFGRGYGEENDWSVRGTTSGWRHLAAPEIYVLHVGNVSFDAESADRKHAAIERLNQMHPNYIPDVLKFIAKDPLRRARRAVDVQRIRGDDRGRAVAFLTHGWGGGTDQHVATLTGQLTEAGITAYTIEPVSHDPDSIAIRREGIADLPNLVFDLRVERKEFLETLAALKLGHLHYHHTVGFKHDLCDLPRTLGITYDVTVHDYFQLCPRIQMLDRDGAFCREAAIESCENCASGVQEAGYIDRSVADWRRRHDLFLSGARKCFVPDLDVQSRLRRYFPGLTAVVRQHVDDAAAQLRTARPLRAESGATPRTILVLGAIGPHKGVEILLACVEDAANRKLPLHFRIVGYTCCDDRFAAFRNVQITGKYDKESLLRHVYEAHPQLCFLPSIWPETYSYTLSYAIALGIAPVVFDVGAMPRRLREIDWGHILPLGAQAAEINDALLTLDTAAAPVARRAKAFRNMATLQDYYGTELGVWKYS